MQTTLLEVLIGLNYLNNPIQLNYIWLDFIYNYVKLDLT